MKLLLIVGTEMGNAEMVADCVGESLQEAGIEYDVVSDGSMADAELLARSVLLVITSTTGLGDIPQNIEPLYRELDERRPDLAKLRYGVIGLGDRNYRDTFCGAPKKWDALLAQLGAERVGEPLLLDATDNPTPDEDAVEWLPTWTSQLDL